MDISSGTIKFAKSFKECNFSFILGGNDTKLCFRRICNIALLPYITPRPELMYS